MAISAATRRYTVAFAGNPNCGKTSIFNSLTGKQARVGNYPGVTVEKRSAYVSHEGAIIEFVDLPGVYSLSAMTLDEKAARSFMLHDKPDLVINVVDCGNLERHLYLTTQLLETGVKLILALNMWDEARRQGITIDSAALSHRLQAPVVKTIGHRGLGIGRLMKAVSAALAQKESQSFTSPIKYGAVVDEQIELLAQEVAAAGCNTLPSRWYAISLLEDSLVLDEFASPSAKGRSAIHLAVVGCKTHIRRTLDKDSEAAINDGRFDCIRRTVNDVVKEGAGDRMAFSNRIDSLVTHRYLGYPIFLLLMWLLFQATFVLGKYPADWIALGARALSDLTARILPTGFVSNLLTQGVIAGVGSVLVFVPSITILFLGIAVLEDTGYMARTAFIMDRLMRTLGLQGRAFIPLLMGFGCSVPAIMATRTMQSHRDRVLTILLIPFMSCSARLTVYVLLGSAFFAGNVGNVIFALYLLGIGVAVLVGLFLKNRLFKEQTIPFLIEFPPYRRPTFRVGLSHVWGRVKVYLRKISGVILLASVALWLGSVFPRVTHYSENFDGQIARLQNAADSTSIQTITQLQTRKATEDVSNSLIGRLGHAVEPVLKPMGFNWRMSVSLISGFVAKEVVVSSMGVLYQSGGQADEQHISLITALRRPASGITPLIALAFMVFVLLYTPCISAITAVRAEIGTRWMLFGIGTQLFIAWGAAFLTYRVGLMLGLG